MITRRTLAKLGVIAPAAFQLRGSDGWTSPRVTPFQNQLLPSAPLSPIADDKTALLNDIYSQAVAEKRGAPKPGEADYYEITAARAITSGILPGYQTEIWGYNGQMPGPTFGARLGRPVVLRVHNTIGNRMVVHHHGGHNPPDSDGYPNQYILPGTPQRPPSRTYVYPNSSTRGASLWYHDHVDAGVTGDEGTGHNVYFGLAGFYLLHDEWEAANRDIVRLPSGACDVPLVFQDRLFNSDGTFYYPPFETDGVIGDTFLVNGKVQPRLAVDRRCYRLRLLNGCNARVIQLFLSTGEPLRAIASDDGLLPAAVTTQSIRLTPGERTEVVVDFSRYSPGTKVYLRNCLVQTNGRKPDGLAPLKSGVDFLRFDVSDNPVPNDDTFIPADSHPLRPLTADEAGSEADAVHTRDIRFERGRGIWLINGNVFEPGRIDFAPASRLGSTEIWRFADPSGGWIHPAHFHLEPFRILDRNGTPPGPLEAGLKDVVAIENETVRVLIKFRAQPASFLAAGGHDNVGYYAAHCHNLEHEDMHMMTTYGVQR
jgi:spore coat protein A